MNLCNLCNLCRTHLGRTHPGVGYLRASVPDAPPVSGEKACEHCGRVRTVRRAGAMRLPNRPGVLAALLGTCLLSGGIAVWAVPAVAPLANTAAAIQTAGTQPDSGAQASPTSSSTPSPTTPSDVQAIADQAGAARKQGDLARAAVLYGQGVAIHPQWLEGWWFLGNLNYGANQYDQAIAAFSRYIELAPHAPAAYALRGLCEFETAAYPASLADIEKALALGAANRQRNEQILRYHQALLLTRLGRFEEAITGYSAFIKQGIVNPDIETGLGLAGLRMAVLPGEMDPSGGPFVAATGHAAVTLLTGGAAAGREAFQAVSAAFPNRAWVHYFCGYLLFAKNPDLAVEEFKLELTADSSDPAKIPALALTHAMLAWAAEFRGEYAEALPEAQAAVTAEPGLLMSQLVLGRALVETADVPGAIDHLGQVVTADPQNLEAHISLAKAYSKLGRRDDARRERLLCLQLADKTAGAEQTGGRADAGSPAADGSSAQRPTGNAAPTEGAGADATR